MGIQSPTLLGLTSHPLRHFFSFRSDQEEVPLNWNKWVRQTHRWLSMVFTLVVMAIFITLGMGKEPAYWVYFVPLFPLALLMFTGLYMFALPYGAKWRSRRQSS